MTLDTEQIDAESQARAEGFTREVIGRSFHQELNLLIAPNTDLDSKFNAFDIDVQKLSLYAAGLVYSKTYNNKGKIYAHRNTGIFG